MVDLNSVIIQALQKVAPARQGFGPSPPSRFPMISVLEIANTSVLILDGEDRLSRIAYQVDVWDNGSTRQRCEQTAAAASAVLVRMGFGRDSAQTMKDPSGLHRKCMRFSGRVDEKDLMIYRS